MINKVFVDSDPFCGICRGAPTEMIDIEGIVVSSWAVEQSSFWMVVVRCWVAISSLSRRLIVQPAYIIITSAMLGSVGCVAVLFLFTVEKQAAVWVCACSFFLECCLRA